MRIAVVLVGIMASPAWADDDETPHVILEAGGNVRQFAGAGPKSDADVLARGAATSTTDTAGLLDVRVGLDLAPNVYVALDNELGMLSFNNEVIESAAVVGVRASGRRASLGAEVAGGTRVFLYDSPNKVPRDDGGMVGVFELRVRGEVHLAPYVAAGAVVGTSLVDRGDWMAGLFLAFHNRR